MKSGRIFFALFAIVWSAMALVALGLVGWPAGQQFRTTWFAETTGVITKSAIARGSIPGEGPSYNVDICYDYFVPSEARVEPERAGAQEALKLSGSRLYYGTTATSGKGARDWVDDALRNFPVGARVPVYFDPKNPADAVLVRGLQGSHLFLGLVLTPFVVLMLGLWWAVRTEFRGDEAWPRVEIIEPLDGVIAVRLVELAPLGMGLCVLAPVAFLSVFPVAFTTGFYPSLGIMLIVWTLVICASALAFAWQRRKVRVGEFDLIVDPKAGTASLPLHDGRKTRVTILLAEIEAVDIEKKLEGTSDGEGPPSWWPRIVLRDGIAHRLVQRGERSGLAIAEMLSARFDWPFRPPGQSA